MRELLCEGSAMKHFDNSGEGPGLGKQDRIWNSALSLINCVTLSMLMNFSVLQFSHLWEGAIIISTL